MPNTMYSVLDSEVTARTVHGLLDDQNKLTGIYEGRLPPEYDRFFPKNSPKQIVNMTRLAWDDLATSIGRIPDFRGRALDNTRKEERFVGKLEKIAHMYFREAKPSGKIFMWQLAWWLIGLGRACAVVLPDSEAKIPRLSIRDPRYVYPGIKETAGNQIVELDDVIFKYELPAQEMRNRGLEVADRSSSAPGSKRDVGEVIEYIDRQKWIIASDGGTVKQAAHGMGIVPAWIFQTHAPDKTAGLSQFEDQITFMVAISRMLSQKQRFADRLAHGIYWVKGHEGTVTIGPDVVNKLSPQGEMGQLSPPLQLQVDRDIELLARFSRLLNRNPEVRQGEVNAKGAYTSAKTLEQLAEAIDTVIGRHWDILSVGLQHLVKVMFTMDEKLWPMDEKVMTGSIKNKRFSGQYVPSVDIAGRYYLNVDYGFGLGGYQGFLMQVQMMGAHLQSRKGAIEEMPGVSDTDEKMREIELQDMDDAGTAAFMAKAQAGQLDVILWATLRDKMATKGWPLSKVISEYEVEIREQAQQAVDQGGADPITAAPGPAQEDQGAPEQGLPSIPPQALIGV